MVLQVMWAILRRWYVVLVGLLLTGGLVYGAILASPPEYHARGLVLLLPSDAAVGKRGNPFLQLSGLEQPAGILVASLSSAPAREQVRAVSPTADYVIGIDDSTRGPVIAVDVTASSRMETIDTLNHLIEDVPAELRRLQQQVDAPANSSIKSMPLSVDSKAEVSRAGTVRVAIAALAVGLLGTGFGAYTIDSWAQRRRLRRPRDRADHRKRRGEVAERTGAMGEPVEGDQRRDETVRSPAFSARAECNS